METRLRTLAILAAALGPAACVPADLGGSGGYRRIELVATADGVDRGGVDIVTGVRCIDATRCAIATRNRNDGGALFATADGATLEPVLTSADIVEATGLIGTAQFLAIDDTGSGWIARLDIAEPFVMTTGDPSTPAGWTMLDVGVNESDSDFTVLNNQELVRAGTGGGWLYAYSGVVWGTQAAPGPQTAWDGLWAPQRVPTFPREYDALKAADPTLCDSDPTVAIDPDMGAFGYASPDLQLVVYPAGGRNQGGSDAPGACVSRDGGMTFHQQPFPDLDPSEIGPLAVQCVDPDRCWAIGGVAFDSAPAYVYYTRDASAAAPTWQRGQVPSTDDADQPRAIGIAADGEHGWLVGDDGLVWSTADGGATWRDEGGALESAAGATIDWASVYVLDAGRTWFGGADGTVIVRE